MSEALNILNDIVADRLDYTGDLLTNQRTGLTFRAEVEPIQDIELNTELGRDARESVTIHVFDWTADLKLNDLVSATLMGEACTLKLLRRTANPASPMIDFGCQKMTDKDT